MGLAALLAAVAAPLIGRAEALPPELLRDFPELAQARYRRGGIMPRLGGWALGASTVAGITMWRTIFLAPRTRLDAELLLHELAHVHQFQASRTFPVQYLWESVRRGYRHNRFEAEADAFAARCLVRRRPGAGADSPFEDR